MSSELDIIKIKAIEERMFSNLRGVIDYNKAQEQEMQTLQQEIIVLKGHVVSQNKDIEELRRQLALLQQNFYAKGST